MKNNKRDYGSLFANFVFGSNILRNDDDEMSFVCINDKVNKMSSIGAIYCDQSPSNVPPQRNLSIENRISFACCPQVQVFAIFDGHVTCVDYVSRRFPKLVKKFFLQQWPHIETFEDHCQFEYSLKELVVRYDQEHLSKVDSILRSKSGTSMTMTIIVDENLMSEIATVLSPPIINIFETTIRRGKRLYTLQLGNTRGYIFEKNHNDDNDKQHLYKRAIVETPISAMPSLQVVHIETDQNDNGENHCIVLQSSGIMFESADEVISIINQQQQQTVDGEYEQKKTMVKKIICSTKHNNNSENKAAVLIFL